MLALCLMLLVTYYVLNYADIIDGGLILAFIFQKLPGGACL